MKSIRHRIYEIIEIGRPSDRLSRLADITIVIFIFLSVVSIILESFSDIRQTYGQLLYFVEVCSVIVFSLEYLLRLATADFQIRGKALPMAALRWMLTPLALIDLLAILPFYLPMLIPLDLRFLRMVRILRLMRIFKLHRYSRALAAMNHALRERKMELVATIFICAILLIISSTFMYYLENKAQPEAFPNVLATLWWSVATLTTVGYGDVYPITPAGKLLGGIIALFGVGLIALPTGILSAAFMDNLSRQGIKRELTELQHRNIRCPHCGKNIEPEG